MSQRFNNANNETRDENATAVLDKFAGKLERRDFGCVCLFFSSGSGLEPSKPSHGTPRHHQISKLIQIQDEGKEENCNVTNVESMTVYNRGALFLLLGVCVGGSWV